MLAKEAVRLKCEPKSSHKSEKCQLYQAAMPSTRSRGITATKTLPELFSIVHKLQLDVARLLRQKRYKNGADGKDGAAGINGLNGAAGASGKNGTNGRNGTNGKDGAAGQAGTNGLNGAVGASGKNGADGMNVISDTVVGASGEAGSIAAVSELGKTAADGKEVPGGKDVATFSECRRILVKVVCNDNVDGLTFPLRFHMSKRVPFTKIMAFICQKAGVPLCPASQSMHLSSWGLRIAETDNPITLGYGDCDEMTMSLNRDRYQ